MTPRELALKAAVLTALQDFIAKERGNARVEADEALRAFHTMSGSKALDIELPDGTSVATLSLSDPKPKPAVTDPAAWLKWVEANRPDEIVPTVRSSFTEAMLAAVAFDDGIAHIDGEVIDGLGLAEARQSTVSLRFTKTGRDEIAAAYRSGVLSDVTRGVLE